MENKVVNLVGLNKVVSGIKWMNGMMIVCSSAEVVEARLVQW